LFNGIKTYSNTSCSFFTVRGGGLFRGSEGNTTEGSNSNEYKEKEKDDEKRTQINKRHTLLFVHGMGSESIPIVSYLTLRYEHLLHSTTLQRKSKDIKRRNKYI
jgi:hypothetical protein